MKKERTEEKHPSYCMVQMSRMQGGNRRFFGSSVISHSYIELRVYPATRQHDLGRDWIFAEPRPMIEVCLSPAQFAELLTSMNAGSGTPATLKAFDGKRIEEPPYQETEAACVREGFEGVLGERAASYRVAYEEAKAILNKKSVSMADRRQVLKVLDSMVAQFTSAMPFYLEQFEEAAKKMTAEAKAEVDAFVTGYIQRAGLEHLKAMAPQLDSPKEP